MTYKLLKTEVDPYIKCSREKKKLKIDVLGFPGDDASGQKLLHLIEKELSDNHNIHPDDVVTLDAGKTRDSMYGKIQYDSIIRTIIPTVYDVVKENGKLIVKGLSQEKGEELARVFTKLRKQGNLWVLIG